MGQSYDELQDSGSHDPNYSYTEVPSADTSYPADSGRAMLADRKVAGVRHQTGNYSGPSSNRRAGNPDQ